MYNPCFSPKNIENGSEEGEIRKLYKRTSLFIRSLFTISRLLPCYPLLQQKLPFRIELNINGEGFAHSAVMGKLGESLISSESGEEQKAFESVNKTELSVLQTNHGDLEISVQFKRLSGKFYTIMRSPAIRVPQQVIKAKDIQVKSSPVGSGDWVDMTQQHMYTLKKHSRQQSLQTSTSVGQVKILTTAHKPVASSLADKPNPSTMKATDFIKLFEKIPDLTATVNNPAMNTAQMIQVLESGRSRKIHFDRWLEELEIEHESFMAVGFDLINNME